MFLLVLRPVNEYKIAEKIESANKELFDGKTSVEYFDHNSSTIEVQSLIENNTGEADGDLDIDQSAGKSASLSIGRQSLSVESERSKRVTFRMDLEEFEPEFISDIEDANDSHADDSVSESDDDNALNRGRLNNNVNSNSLKSCELSDNNNFQSINVMNIVETDRFGEVLLMTDDATLKPVSDDGGLLDCHENSSDDGCAEGLEEICEVIEDFGLAEYPESRPSVVVKESLTTAENFEQIDDIKSSSSSVSDSEHSKIVKPLITKRRSLPIQNHKPLKSTNISVSLSQPSTAKPTCKHKPTRHHPSSSSASTSASSHSRSHPSSATSDILKIQLNFKPCCEHKHLETQRLPRYCGYLSQYGLSKEQLERRDARRERHHHRRCKRIERQEQEELLKSLINEEAFASWLRLKMRTNHNNGTRNMYDVVQQPVRARFGRNRQF